MAVEPIRRAPRPPSARRNQGMLDMFSAGMLSALLGNRILREGDSGSAVREVQRSLIQLGHDLEPSGCFDPVTKTAVIEFQRRHGIQTDGQVDRRTAAALDALLATSA